MKKFQIVLLIFAALAVSFVAGIMASTWGFISPDQIASVFVIDDFTATSAIVDMETDTLPTIEALEHMAEAGNSDDSEDSEDSEESEGSEEESEELSLTNSTKKKKPREFENLKPWTEYLDDACAPVTALETRYTLKKIMSAKMNKNPYDHLYIKDIYHPRVYACMLKSMPDNNSTSFVQTQKKPRFSIPVKCASKKMGILNPKFWRSFSEKLGGGAVAGAFMSRFKATLRARGTTGKTQVEYSLELSRDLFQWFIAPHTDSANKYVTTLYYLPWDDKNKNLGTGIFKKTGRQTKLVKVAPFVPNTVLAFAPTGNSWHGVSQSQLKGVTTGRDTIQAFVRPKSARSKLIRCPTYSSAQKKAETGSFDRADAKMGQSLASATARLASEKSPAKVEKPKKKSKAVAEEVAEDEPAEMDADGSAEVDMGDEGEADEEE